MSVNEAVKRIFKLVKCFFDIGNSNGRNSNVEIETPELPLLAVYEVKRTEIEESTEPIEGVFYIHNGHIIPDFYSECLSSDKDNPRRNQMYHYNFFRSYIWRKYDGLTYGEEMLPRGRIKVIGDRPIIYIDKCYFQDAKMISQLIELYNLPEKAEILSHSNYRCPACYDRQNRKIDLVTYTFNS